MTISFKDTDPIDDYKVVDPGKYLCEINEIKDKDGPNGPYLNVRFKILEGEFKNRFLFDRLSYSSPKAINRIKILLSRCNFNIDVEEIDLNPDELIGLHVIVETKVIEYEGRPQNKVPFNGFYNAVEHIDKTGIRKELTTSKEKEPLPF